MGRLSRCGPAVALVCVVLTGCATTVSISAARPRGGPVASNVAAVPFLLYTHCGIRELAFQGNWYERVGGSLSDGNGNPPPGWGNPQQPGALTRNGPTVVFTDALGHHERFRLRPGATGPKTVCS